MKSCDYFFLGGGVLKDHVFSSLPPSIADLKSETCAVTENVGTDVLIRTVQNVGTDVLIRTVQNFLVRTHRRVEVDGGQTY
jgi:hypothetical protein